MKLPEIIGISGTNGAGKDTLAELRAAKQGARHVSASNILRTELDRRGLPHERENLRALGDEWRNQYGPAVLIAKTIEEYRASKDGEAQLGLTITSVRNPLEAEAILQAGGAMIWVDADRQIRYERITNRPGQRPEDKKTFEQFCAEEDTEMHPTNPDDPAVLNMSAVKEKSNVFVTNDFADIAQYEAYLIREFELDK